MPELEPITREEKLLDGEDLTPITRKEKFIKRIYDKTQSVPEPITREEMFLKKAGEGSGGDVTIEQLNVTENGTYTEQGKAFSPVIVEVPQPTLTKLTATENRTYTAPSGTAYNEVDVDVPLPSNAYLLKELSNLPQPIASFSDGAEDLPLKSLTASIVPVQAGSGDPSPTNVRPISGWTEEVITRTGVNVWDEEWELDANHRLSSKNYIPVKPNTEYIFCNTYLYTITGYDKDKNSTGGISLRQVQNVGYKFTAPLNCDFIKFKVGNSYGTTYNNDISINYPSTDTEYHAYSGTTTTIPFTDSQGNPVEVYGGSVDVVNGGEQPRTLGSVDMDDMNWTYSDSGYFTGTIPGCIIPTIYSNHKPMCEVYKGENPNYINALNNGEIMYNTTFGAVFVKDTNYTDATSFKNSVAGKKIVYELATPTTFNTQPTSIKSLDGVNNVFASTGDVEELKYFSKEAE